MKKKRAMSSEKASYVKRKGHEDAREFAELLGIGKEFKWDPRAKRDIIDEEGFSYSVKSGEKKWQIFLYGRKRFEENFNFKGMGLSEIFLECIDSFPENRDEYLKNKVKYKEKLKISMIKLANELNDQKKLEAFLYKAIFNSGEVDFLVIKEEGEFHVFYNKDVVNCLSQNFQIENSKARRSGEIDAQKVVFKVSVKSSANKIYKKTAGEIEMRNDSDIHYREVKFWLDKKVIFRILSSQIKPVRDLRDRIKLYGQAIRILIKYLK